MTQYIDVSPCFPIYPNIWYDYISRGGSEEIVLLYVHDCMSILSSSTLHLYYHYASLFSLLFYFLLFSFISIEPYGKYRAIMHDITTQVFVEVPGKDGQSYESRID